MNLNRNLITIYIFIDIFFFVYRNVVFECCEVSSFEHSERSQMYSREQCYN